MLSWLPCRGPNDSLICPIFTRVHLVATLFNTSVMHCHSSQSVVGTGGLYNTSFMNTWKLELKCWIWQTEGPWNSMCTSNIPTKKQCVVIGTHLGIGMCCTIKISLVIMYCPHQIIFPATERW